MNMGVSSILTPSPSNETREDASEEGPQHGSELADYGMSACLCYKHRIPQLSE
jgi:hypothetical protein